MALFELGLTTIGKNFFKIHHQHLPGKEIKDIVLFYYKVMTPSLKHDSNKKKLSGKKQNEPIATGQRRAIRNENSKTVRITWTNYSTTLKPNAHVVVKRQKGKEIDL